MRKFSVIGNLEKSGLSGLFKFAYKIRKIRMDLVDIFDVDIPNKKALPNNRPSPLLATRILNSAKILASLAGLFDAPKSFVSA